MAEVRIQIIYASAATRDYTPENLEALLRLARKRNEKRGITGMLVYHNQSFLQVLEGPVSEVRRVFDKIGRDPGHDDVRLILEKNIETNEFGDWSMGFADTRSNAPKLAGFVNYDDAFAKAIQGGATARKVLKAFQEGQWRQGDERRKMRTIASV